MQRSNHLVSQHLEGIQRVAFDQYPDLVLDLVARRSGVYALHQGTKLYYVGLARDLKQRLKAHMRNRHGEKWDRFSVYLTIGERHLKEMESLILRILQPPGNAVRGKFPKSQDLKRAFGREIKRRDEGKRRDLLGRAPQPAVRPPNPRSAVTGRIPILSGFHIGGTKLRGTVRRVEYRAIVKADGSVRYKGAVYNSPSSAGRAATGRSCNGWHFWKYERAPGDWVRLRELRR